MSKQARNAEAVRLLEKQREEMRVFHERAERMRNLRITRNLKGGAGQAGLAEEANHLFRLKDSATVVMETVEKLASKAAMGVPNREMTSLVEGDATDYAAHPMTEEERMLAWRALSLSGDCARLFHKTHRCWGEGVAAYYRKESFDGKEKADA